MKILLQPFAALAMRWQRDDFWRARLKLTTLYLIIIACITLLFSGYLLVTLERQLEALTTSVEAESISEADAVEIARRVVPEGTIAEIETEIVGRTMVYAVEFVSGESDIDVYIDRVTGEVLSNAGSGQGVETFEDEFLNDFSENIVWANVLILSLSGLLSYWLAGRTLRPIEEKMRQQEQFSNDVAHELRTPLSALYAAVSAVLRKPETALVYQETLSDVQKETTRLISLTEDLLESARGHGAIDFELVPVRPILTTAIDRLQSFADEEEVRLSLLGKNDWSVMGSEDMLERLISNLVHNAIKFSPAGSVVTVDMTEPGVVTVKDQGAGIPAEQQPYLFDRFYTTNAARDERGIRGSGLGLSIVKQIADLHDANILIKSEVNNGTCVYVNFLQGTFS